MSGNKKYTAIKAIIDSEKNQFAYSSANSVIKATNSALYRMKTPMNIGVILTYGHEKAGAAPAKVKSLLKRINLL